MNQTDHEKLKNSLNNLIEQYKNYLTLDEQNLTEVNQKAVKNSVIKCFEICNDIAWKHIKKFMEEEMFLVEVPGSPQGVFRRAHESGLIDEEMQKRLVTYNKLRGLSAHDYSLEKGEEALARIDEFIQDIEEIRQTMLEEWTKNDL